MLLHFFFISDISLQDPLIYINLAALIHQPAFQFVVFKPLSYCFEKIIGFNKYASFARPSVLPLIKPDHITKEFQ